MEVGQAGSPGGFARAKYCFSNGELRWHLADPRLRRV